jgi:2'-hydroxyisoflavone reductase
MRLLVLGGTRFVGRALVAEAVSRGWSVTALNRGVTGTVPDGVTELRVDRTVPGALAAAVDGVERFDLVVDTWTAAPAVATEAAGVLAPLTDRYGYVSSISVYEWGRHVDESSPLVDGDPDATDGEYPALKRGGELGVLAHVPDALLVRCGLILGPHEDVGRLPWWLSRIARGGRVVAPGRPARALQLVDVRDLAAFTLDALVSGVSGPVDVTSPSGHATTGTLLQACVDVTGSGAELVWVDEATLVAADVAPWTELPCWVPETAEFAGFMESDTALAHRLGLRCRPVHDTVADTWEWLRDEDRVDGPPSRTRLGLPEDKERVLLA